VSFKEILGKTNQFIFGGNTGTSYEDLQAKRRAAQQHAKQTNQGGFHGLANGIVTGVLRGQARKAEKAGREKFDGAFQQILGRGQSAQGGTPFNPSAQGGPAQPAPMMGQPTPSRPPSGDMAASVRQGLTARGLPEHVAEAFVMNFQDESGLNPGINETTPTVAGSRGGFGLAQWTGPRRRELEAFAAQNGSAVSDMDTQLDFLVHELQGSEAGAAQSIFASQDAGSAADAIVRKFLRPAEEHRERRSARYLGGAQPPQQPSGIDPQLIQLATSPWASPEQKSVLGMLLQQQMSANAPVDPMKQLQMQKMQLELDQMRDPQVDPMQQVQLEQAQLNLEQDRNPQPDPVRGVQFGDNLVNPITGEVIAEGEPEARDQTSAMQNYEYYTQQETEAGRAPSSFNEWNLQSRRAGATTVNNSVSGGVPELTVDAAKNTGFLIRTQEANDIINSLENEGTNFWQQQAENVPLGLGNQLRSPEFQKFDQARRDYVNAILRRESGAVISDQEFANAEQQYFPVPGDGPEVIAQKRNNRKAAIAGLRVGSGAGGAYADNMGAQTPAQPSIDLSGMSRGDLLYVDIGSLSPDQYDEYERLLGGGDQ
jgi:hypothetical protein